MGLPNIPSDSIHGKPADGGKEDWGALALAFAPDGDVIVAGPRGVRRFDVETGHPTWLWPLDQTMAASLAASADGRYVIAAAHSRDPQGSQSHPVKLFDLQRGDARLITSQGTRVIVVALQRKGGVVVTGDRHGVVRVGSSDGGEPHLLLGHRDSIRSVAVSPDGRWIASADSERIRVWPMPDVSKTPLHTLPREDLIAKLGDFTNLRVVDDVSAPTRYRIEMGPFPGWEAVPVW